jgi:cysteine desulfurase
MKKMKVYLDYASTTPVRKEVLKEALPYFSEKFGNPSSFHSKGLETKNVMDSARTRIGKIIGAKPNEIIFTGSGTESINLAIKGVALKQMKKGKKHLITQKTEHHAVLHSMKYLEKEFGFKITYLNVNKDGLINLKELENTITNETALVSIMYANNEIGTIQPIKKISKICKKKGTLFHSDACQATEYLDINVKNLGIDLMTLNGSKAYSFKGTGLLYLKNGVEIIPLISGGGHEFGKRAGTENVAGIVGLAKALELAKKEKKQESKRLTKLRNYFIEKIQKEIPKIYINGSIKHRLPNNINISFEGIEGESIMLYLDKEGIQVSTGSACTSQTLDPSHVLIAIGKTHGLAHGSIRFTMGKYTTKKELDYTTKVLKKIVLKLRIISSAWNER